MPASVTSRAMPDPGPRRSLLLGWGNATAGQLRAYERLHQALGLAPRAVLPSTAKGILAPAVYARAVFPVAEAMLAGEPIELVHIFSDNGFLAWSALLERLAREGDAGRRAKAAIRGVVMDSSPGLWATRGKREFASRFAGAMTPLVARALGKEPTAPLPAVTAALTAAFVAYQVVHPAFVRSARGAADLIAREQPLVPHLVLYAREDRLVPARDVEAWIARQRARGLPVTARCFGRARHVALYPDDPRRYRGELAEFLRRIACEDSRAELVDG